MKILKFILRFVVGGLFVYAGLVKIIEPAVFATDVANFRLLPHVLVHLVAITLPWIEVVAGLLLVCGVWPRASALVLTGLMLVFLAGIGQALVRGLDIRCGCFGTVEGRKVGFSVLAQDVALLTMAAWIWWRSEK